MIPRRVCSGWRDPRLRVTCPTLVLDGENDPGDASQLYEALRGQKTYHLFPAAEGAVNAAKRE